jgi:hypothetical protein
MSQATNAPQPTDDPTADCRQALALAGALLPSLPDLPADPSHYKLVVAENVLAGAAHGGPHLWRLTFKLRELLPHNGDSAIGAGVEIFVEVDLAAQRARLAGYGE